MRILSICERPAVRFVLAPIRRIVWTSDQTEFVVVYFPCVVSEHAQFMMCVIGSRSQRIVICTKTFISSPYHACLHTSVPNHWSPLPFFDQSTLHNHSGHVADQWTLCTRSTEWGVWLCGQNNLFDTIWRTNTLWPPSTHMSQKDTNPEINRTRRTKRVPTNLGRANTNQTTTEQTAQKWNVIWLFATQSCAFSQRRQQLHEHTQRDPWPKPEISQAENRRAHTFLCSSFQTHEPRNNVNVNSTPHTSPFSRSQRALIMMCDTTLAQVLVRVIPSMCRAPEWLSVLFSILTLPSSASFSIFHFFFLNIDFYIFLFLVAVLGARSLVHFAQWGVWPFGQ